MQNEAPVSVGQFSQKGRKAINQDAINTYIPTEPTLTTKGVVVALADGISSSNVSQEASKTMVTGFVDDYFSTSEAWSTETAGKQVITALNSWLYAQTQRSEFKYNIDKGYVCTFSAVVVKGSKAHIFHVGDAKVMLLSGNQLKSLTQAHRTVVSSQESYLARAAGMRASIDIDYKQVELKTGDTLLLMTDGVYEFVSEARIQAIIQNCKANLALAATQLTDAAYDNNSDDNLSAQVIRVNSLPEKRTADLYQSLVSLPFPPKLEPRMQFDGYTIERQLYDSARSTVFVATDNDSKEKVVIKTLSIELQTDETHRQRFFLEEWIARRVTSAHLLKPKQTERQRNYFYVVTEYIQGQTLSQWMLDNPSPKIEQVREIVEQIARGLMALHRKEMLHQDLRPENIMIENSGTVKIIDYGAVRVAGIDEILCDSFYDDILGTALYAAPEYFLGESGTQASDQFSLAVITYHMLSGHFPYGSNIAKTNTRAAQKKLNYRSVLHDDLAIPAWVDYALKKALHPNPLKRYGDLSEFLFDLRQPSKAFLNQTRAPIIERNPLAFWQSISAILLIVVIVLLYTR